VIELDRRVVVEGDPSHGPDEDEEISIANEGGRRGLDVQVASLRQLPRTIVEPSFARSPAACHLSKQH
jgi:hypothetical protein